RRRRRPHQRPALRLRGAVGPSTIGTHRTRRLSQLTVARGGTCHGGRFRNTTALRALRDPPNGSVTQQHHAAAHRGTLHRRLMDLIDTAQADLAHLQGVARASHDLIRRHQDTTGAYPASPTFSAYRGYAWLRDGAFIAEGMSRW